MKLQVTKDNKGRLYLIDENMQKVAACLITGKPAADLMRLLAAAPDMLEACCVAINQAGISVDAPSYEFIHKAIKKAKGTK